MSSFEFELLVRPIAESGEVDRSVESDVEGNGFSGVDESSQAFKSFILSVKSLMSELSVRVSKNESIEAQLRTEVEFRLRYGFFGNCCSHFMTCLQ